VERFGSGFGRTGQPHGLLVGWAVFLAVSSHG